MAAVIVIIIIIIIIIIITVIIIIIIITVIIIMCRADSHAASKLFGSANTDERVVANVADAEGESRERDNEIDRGASLGRYTVLGRLGAGAMGVVYAAYDPELDRKVALRVLRPPDGDTLDATEHSKSLALTRERLLREAQALAKLSHPNVVTVYDVGTVGGDVFIAMVDVRIVAACFITRSCVDDLGFCGCHLWVQPHGVVSIPLSRRATPTRRRSALGRVVDALTMREQFDIQPGMALCGSNERDTAMPMHVVVRNGESASTLRSAANVPRSRRLWMIVNPPRGLMP